MSWKVISLGELCELNTGGTPSRTQQEYFENGEISWLVSGDINKREIFECDGRITELGYKNSNAKFLPIDSVLIALNGQGKTRGTVALLRMKATCNQSLVSIYPKAGVKLDTKYLFYFLDGKYDEIRRLTGDSGNDRRGLNMPLIRNIKINIPSTIEIQIKIVAKLDAIFAEIDKATAAAEANAKNAEALFQSYLTEVFERGGNDWKDTKLSDISTYFGRGKSKHRPRNDESLYDGLYPFIQTGDVRNAKKYITSYSQTYNEKGLAQSKLWAANTVCITIAANIAEIGILGFDACFPDSVIGVVVDKEKISEDFLYLMLLFAQQLIKSKSKGSAQENINLGTFEDMFFKVPSKVTQSKVVAELNDLKKLTDLILNSQNEKIKSLNFLKQSILKQAFNGELVKA